VRQCDKTPAEAASHSVSRSVSTRPALELLRPCGQQFGDALGVQLSFLQDPESEKSNPFGLKVTAKVLWRTSISLILSNMARLGIFNSNMLGGYRYRATLFGTQMHNMERIHAKVAL